MLSGIDTATPLSAAQAAQIHAQGYRFVARYLSTAGNPKNLTAPEAQAILRAGLGIVLVFETTAQRQLGGHAAGIADANLAAAQARVCGAPLGVPIYFAADWDVQPSELPEVGAYLAGAGLAIGEHRVGEYGGLRVCTYAIEHGLAAYAWQTLAWSGGVWNPSAQLRQVENGVTVAGVSCDRDLAVHPEYGQWGGAPVKRYKWRVRGDGRRIVGHTNRRLRWIVRHPRRYRAQRRLLAFERILHT